MDSPIDARADLSKHRIRIRARANPIKSKNA